MLDFRTRFSLWRREEAVTPITGSAWTEGIICLQKPNIVDFGANLFDSTNQITRIYRQLPAPAPVCYRPAGQGRALAQLHSNQNLQTGGVILINAHFRFSFQLIRMAEDTNNAEIPDGEVAPTEDIQEQGKM